MLTKKMQTQDIAEEKLSDLLANTLGDCIDTESTKIAKRKGISKQAAADEFIAQAAEQARKEMQERHATEN